MSKHVGCSLTVKLAHSCSVSALSINTTHFSWTKDIRGEVHNQFGSGGYQKWSRAWCLAVRGVLRDPVFTQRNFFSETRVRLLSEAAAISDNITSSFVYAPWSEMESESSEYVFWRFEDVLPKGTWSASCCQIYERKVVCFGCYAAVIRWISLTIRCPHINSCGRG